MARLVGVDIGGTHTDLIFVDDEAGRLSVAKVPTTPDNQAQGLFDGLAALAVGASEIDLLIHGTTVATNATIERTGAHCGLITTRGFGDVLELRRRDRPQVYGLIGTFVPLVPRRRRLEVDERCSAEGEILTPVDVDQVREAARRLLEAGVEVVVVSFLHSYANPANERVARQALADVWPNDYAVIASDILPTLREFERTSTAVISGYVQPLVGRYLKRLEERLKDEGYERDLLVVQSNGGVMASRVASDFAANTILSGPAAGITAAAAIAAELDIANIVSCDMGGTSLDICLIKGGRPALTQNRAVDFGLPLCLPMLDVDTIGAGGGSLARIDASGILKVGPESAGAKPGPVCYGQGGTVPTITDANVVLGLLDPDLMIGRDHGLEMDRELAGVAIAEQIGKPLDLDAEAAAEAILTVAGQLMAGQIRRRLVEHGHDPRDFTLVAFGGAGPLHANRLMREVGFARAVIPYYPGVTSALGCVLGRLRHDFMQTVNMNLSGFDLDALGAVYKAQVERGTAILASEGVAAGEVTTLFGADMCYHGQIHVIAVDFPVGAPLTPVTIRRAFEETYERRYGRLLEFADIRLVNARTTCFGATPEIDISRKPVPALNGAPKPRHAPIVFNGTATETAIYRRAELAAGTAIGGPALVTQADSTCFIEPGYQALVHDTGALILEARP